MMTLTQPPWRYMVFYEFDTGQLDLTVVRLSDGPIVLPLPIVHAVARPCPSCGKWNMVAQLCDESVATELMVEASSFKDLGAQLTGLFTQYCSASQAESLAKGVTDLVQDAWLKQAAFLN